MRRIAKLKKQRLCALTAAIVASAWMPTAMALPTDADVVNKTGADVAWSEDKNTMDVTLSAKRSAIDWKTFNVDQGQVVNFKGIQGNEAGWMVLNRVVGENNKIPESIINGSINGQGGTVFLINPSGITFGKGAEVNVGSLVASTLDTNKDKFLDVKNSTFNFTSENGAKITNLGNIKASDDGVVALLAHQVVSGGEITTDSNGAFVSAKPLTSHNTITAGQVAMAAGKKITLTFADKIDVKLDESSADYDFVINASDVTANRGYVLMKAGDAREIGSHLICQTGKVAAANKLTMDEGGNIILQAENVNAGGTLTADGKNSKIEILGNSLVTANASAQGAGAEINIDTNNGASVILAGANLTADTKITTKSNHSVIALENTKINVTKKENDAGWDIKASKVKVGKDVNLTVNESDIDLMGKAMAHQLDYNNLSNEEKTRIGELANVAYTISNNVISTALANTNVNIETNQFPNHYVFTQEGIQNAPNAHYTENDVNGDNNIEINADIVKNTGDDVTSLTMKAMGTVNLNADITTDRDAAKALNVTLEARGISGLIEPDTLNNPENIAYKEIQGNTFILVNDNERKITTWGKENTAGTVTIKSKVDSADAANHGALTIKSGDTFIQENVGDSQALKALSIYSKGNILVAGNVKADDKVIAVATDTPDNDSYFMAKPADEKQNVTVGAIQAKTVTLAADNDVILNGNITANATGNAKAVEIVAQRNFNNKGNGNISVGEGSNWKIYSATPANDNFGGLNSSNFAVWSWGRAGFKYNANDDDKNRYIFKETPKLTITANSGFKRYGQEIADLGYTWSYDLKGQFLNAFSDGDESQLKTVYGLGDFGTDSLGYPVDAEIGRYDVNLTKAEKAYDDLKAMGYDVILQPGTLAVTDGVRPQLENLTTSNLQGSASYNQAPRQAGPGADRVLGLQSAELPVFREENGQIKLYGTYDVSVDPDKVKMEPTAKVLPEPDQPKNQYREYDKELTTKAGTAKFKMTYNGSTFDIYPVDNSAKKLLAVGDAAKNVEVESQALFAAFKEMGITLDALDGVYTHFDSKKEVQSFRR